MRKSTAVFLVAVLVTLTTSAFAQDGPGLFRQCASCHVLEAGGPARIGPHLSGIANRPAAGLADYRYSDALQQRSQQGLTWNAQTLDQFLAGPGAYVPGTQMGFAGIKDAAKRAVLVEWLLNETAVASDDSAAMQDDEAVQRILSQDADPDYGEYLAGECLTCHKAQGSTPGVPPIVGLSAAQFVRALLDYKEGVRTNQVMNLMAGNLGDGDIGALAVYFSSL